MNVYLLDELFQDNTDPNTPIFWETLNWMSRQGADVAKPDVELPEPSIGVQIMELKRKIAIDTPTQLMKVVPGEPA